jgi:hypothetical protein
MSTPLRPYAADGLGFGGSISKEGGFDIASRPQIRHSNTRMRSPLATVWTECCRIGTWQRRHSGTTPRTTFPYYSPAASCYCRGWELVHLEFLDKSEPKGFFAPANRKAARQRVSQAAFVTAGKQNVSK